MSAEQARLEQAVRFLSAVVGDDARPASAAPVLLYRIGARELYADDWPGDRADVADELVAESERGDVYVCPALRFTPRRSKGTACPPRVCWTDIDQDEPADLALYRKLVDRGAVVVHSGTGTRRHVYTPLSRPVSIGEHLALNRALCAALGGDTSKVTDESLLRPPGTFNHKHDPPRPVTLAEPGTGERIDPDELAALLGVADLPAAAVVADRNEAAAAAEQVAAFHAEHDGGDRLELLRAGPVVEFDPTPDRRHPSLMVAAPWALRDARAGLYPADTARAELRRVFLAAKPGADAEFARAWSWAVAQADAETEESIVERAARVARPEPRRRLAVADTTDQGDGADLDEQPDTWAPRDLGPALRGERTPAVLSVGAARSDGARLLYPGKEHLAIGETESGKSWFALACVAQELMHNRPVVYIHFEEQDETDTVERLLLLGVAAARIADRLVFVAPESPATPATLGRLAALRPSLVVLDGKNEAMGLHGLEIMKPEGAAEYRRRLVRPFTRVGAATLDLDHVVKDPAAKGAGYALGSGHKVNGVTGAVFLLENREPFGRGRRGRTSIYVTKDRPARLRALGEPTRMARKFHVGEMVADATDPAAFMFEVWAPNPDRDNAAGDDDTARLDVVVDAVRAAAALGGGSLPLDEVKLSDVLARLSGRREERHHLVDAAVQAGRLLRDTGPRGVHLLSLPPGERNDHSPADSS